jgi:hypothetical protein
MAAGRDLTGLRLENWKKRIEQFWMVRPNTEGFGILGATGVLLWKLLWSGGDIQ